ncbi:recombination-related endonuclease [Synechococcus phage S-SZBM1]|uniref:Recombination-related endonuclease n=1 Tax=Synechococcus phage S-SZBM1 TaxID=2926475 RepID=A0AC61TSS0_9CAUD|nr:SbcD-like subunit of palindrome specific endonuclease [Synechococcus phage S-SZBM1]UNH61285.1 recombination-related endonuclease [Synechococcus phage S-SZBM1]
MKILLITDQHFGVRNDNQFYVEKYRLFYEKTVLPYIDENKITHVIALGDTFDKRKSINFSSLEAAKSMWFDPLLERNVRMLMLTGNHDIYYKNTLRVNSPKLLLQEYPNITVVDDPIECTFGGTSILLLPWICDDNRERSISKIKASDSSICLGHLELNGFEAIPGHTMEHGDDPTLFAKFDLVCSGHFHMRSRKENIQYLGNPYQLYWNDYGQDRGFHVLNTDTKKLTFVKNPNQMFYKVYYRDEETAQIDYDALEGSYVKMIVEKKEDQVLFDTTLKKIVDSKVADLKIIEDHYTLLNEVDESIESEDTLAILQNCVSEIDNKDEVFGILKSLYLEALKV